jgi:hypothetical protein
VGDEPDPVVDQEGMFFSQSQPWYLLIPIHKGDVINPNQPIVKSFEIQLGPGDTTRLWDSKIVISHNEPMYLPRSFKNRKATPFIGILGYLN